LSVCRIAERTHRAQQLVKCIESDAIKVCTVFHSVLFLSVYKLVHLL